MQLKISFEAQYDRTASQIIVLSTIENAQQFLSGNEYVYATTEAEKKQDFITIDRLGSSVILVVSQDDAQAWKKLEKLRQIGDKLQRKFGYQENKSVQIGGNCPSEDILTISEGFLLSAYDFNKYKTAVNTHKKLVEELIIIGHENLEAQVRELEVVASSVFEGRNWINEPVNNLNAPIFAQQMAEKAGALGIKKFIGDKTWIENERMGGLLAVNKGSVDEPTFTILEWKPENATNTKPIVLVGKGVVFDTGGVSLKDTAFMDWMKSDMGGAAAIAGAMLAIAGNKLPIHIVALIPATDNRPSGNAYVPGDVILMRNGKTVEVLNTDAEGRMILADALDYAEGYKPELIIDVATLTGAAANAFGEFAVVSMGTAADSVFTEIEQIGLSVCERVVRFPFWDEYGDMIKSDIADIKNVGGPVAGAITAGKFLEHFVKSPWVHLDISGSAFVKTESSYRGKGGTAFGVRLLYAFAKKYCKM